MPKKRKRDIGLESRNARRLRIRIIENEIDRVENTGFEDISLLNNIERRVRDREQQNLRRNNESNEERKERLARDRERHTISRQNESAEHRELRLESNRVRNATSRQDESVEQRENRLRSNRERNEIDRLNESSQHRERRLARDRNRHTIARENETSVERQGRLTRNRERHRLRLEEEVIRMRNIRMNESSEETAVRQEGDRERHHTIREVETDNDRQIRLLGEVARHERRNREQWREKFNSGFSYNPHIEYSTGADIGEMNIVCSHCNALRWTDESKDICCSSAKVVIPLIPEPPDPLRSLLNGDLPQSRLFFQNIRLYNSAFQMTSFGANEVYESGFRPTFRIQGQVYHRIGSLLPSPDQLSTFLQIYFMPETQQVERRVSIFNSLDSYLILQIQELLQEHNSYVRSFKSAIEIMPFESLDHRIVIRTDRRPDGDHPGRYNAKPSPEVAIIMVGEPSDLRDIVIQKRSGNLFRISETHRSYDALQYPLMFCRGEDGYHFLYRHIDPASGQFVNKKTSALEFYAYRLMIRKDDPNPLHQFRQLLNQFLVDMYAKIESERLLYFRTHQTELRADKYIHLQDAMSRDENIENLGQKVILPSSFTGGPRYMHSRTQDAFCYVRKFGRPDFFITITTNPRWQEINALLANGQCSQDRHDIVARVFHLKLKRLMALLRKGEIFGSVRCFIYSVEWQKRGLPHAHILLWLEETLIPNRIDDVISAELPDPEADKELFDIVKGHMVHGPCGSFNRQLGCMKEGRCTKRFPKQFVRETITGEDGYPTYHRRSPEDGCFTTDIRVRGEVITVDNRWIVPYSPVLLRTFHTHINVESCGGIRAIKYVCKYVNKGSDQASFSIGNENDEISRFQTDRYISTSEAVWRILEFPIHERYPPVIHLDVHLENGQRVYFRLDNVQRRVENPSSTTLMAFFELCRSDNFAKLLLYHEVPSYYTFNKQSGEFTRRKRGKPVEGHSGIFKDPAIGRVFTIHPQNNECFYLRLLLHHIRGPTSFESLRTTSNQLHATYKDTCRALGLLDNDDHWEEALREASAVDSPCRFRELFAIVVVLGDPGDPLDLWMKFRESLSEDYLWQIQRTFPSATYENSPHLYDLCLEAIQEIMVRIGNKTLRECHLPVPHTLDEEINSEYIRETSYDVNQLLSFVRANEPRLTDEQNNVYQNVLSCVQNATSKQMFFLDAPGGTGKTFLINLILSKVRSEGKIALAVASSGIAATLLPGGRTAHSMFKISINVDQMESPICSITRNCATAKVLRDCVLIIWDECTMSHKRGIEALDRTPRDIRNSNLIMGGVTILFSGDFRQTLPVVVRGTRADEVNASIKKSFLWPNITRLALLKNMRAHLGSEQGAQEFSDLLLAIGNGTLEEDNGLIIIPPFLGTVVSSQEELIEKVFPGIENLPTFQNGWLCERAILTPTNEQAKQTNKKVLSLFQATERTYFSVNSSINDDDSIHYPIEFLDSVTAPGLPAHEINFKVGAPIMLLRNINPPKLCNGTRLRVRALHRFIIEADILTGCAAGEFVFIPRIPLIPSNYPFQFKRLQFPVSLCFAMTINKSQGQTLSTAGIELAESECFSHGQLYVGCSRVSSPDSLFIHSPTGKTRNFVYREVLQ